MRRVRSRAAWAPDRVHKVKSYSFWRRRHGTADQKSERWKVTALFRYEQSSGDVLSVRLHCFGGPTDGHVIHMSEARMLNLFVSDDPPAKTVDGRRRQSRSRKPTSGR